jgi:chromosome segregation ATPase
MANSEIFKTVFKGYSKDEVVAYIDNLNRQAAMLQNELNMANARLEQMEDERKDDAEEQARLAADVDAIRASMAEELAAELTEQIRAELAQELRPAIEQEMRRKVEEEMASKYEAAARTEITQRIQSQAGEVQELRRRAQLYDDNRELLADLMIKAKSDASAIVKEAEDHAAALKEDAEKRYRLLISDYKLLKTNLLAARGEAVEKLNIALKSLEDFEKRFSCMDHDIANSVSHLAE